MQSQMNIKIKFREGFRPFAPSVLREKVGDWFELDADSPYMLLVAPVRTDRRRPTTAEEEGRWGIEKLKVQRSEIPAVTHVDYSARVQTVSREDNPEYYDLIAAFERAPAAPSWSTRRSTSAASRSSAPRRTPIAASCGPTSTTWCCGRSSWTRRTSRRGSEEGDWRKEVPLD